MLSMLKDYVDRRQWNETDELADALNVHFVLSGSLDHCLSDTIRLHDDALNQSLSDRKRYSGVLSNLGNARRSRGENTKEDVENDLEQAVIIHQEVLELYLPYHSDVIDAMHNLGKSLRAYSKKRQRTDSLDKAINLYRQNLKYCPLNHPQRFDVLSTFGETLMILAEKSADLVYLAEAVSLYRKVLELRPPAHPRHVQSLRNLGNALMTYGENSGDVDSLAEAVTLHRRTIELRSPDHLPSSAWLRGDTSRSYSSKDLDGLENVVALCRETTETESRPREHLGRAELLTKLGEAFQEHAIDVKDSAFLEKSVSVRQIALKLHPPNHQHHKSALNSLAEGLLISIPSLTPVGADCSSYLEDLARVLDGWMSNWSQEDGGNFMHERTVEAHSLDKSYYPDMLLWFARILVTYDKESPNTDGLCLAVRLFKKALVAMNQDGHDHCDLVDIDEKELEPLEKFLKEMISTMEFDSQEWNDSE
jgi:tetratricopeptide (TPR) repeat protein